MVPVSRLFVLGIGVGMDLFTVSLWIKVELERVFRHPTFKARTGPGRTLEERGFVVARPRVAAGAGLADISREHQWQIGCAIHFGGMEPMVDAFALVNCDRFHRRDI